MFIAKFVATVIIVFARFITSVRGEWEGIEPTSRQRIYFANHASHGDFVLIWTVLPPRLRHNTRPVAGSDYWLKSKLKEFIGRDVFDAVLVDRNAETRKQDPIEQMASALDLGSSLILFPEGTRNETEEKLLPFKAGLYNLAKMRPEVDLVPVWIENLNRVMPKGEMVPIPLMCTVKFGEAMHVKSRESKDAFLKRARTALLDLAPELDGGLK